MEKSQFWDIVAKARKQGAGDSPKLVGVLWANDDELDAKYPKLVARFEG
jgi:hypothetical protein